ncbi:MAG TPA: hypothetical protein VFN11_01595 [Ktedonobacterales bacterium]|nr:hypothetical protein [Ktedonobacterales bacterium]
MGTYRTSPGYLLRELQRLTEEYGVIGVGQQQPGRFLQCEPGERIVFVWLQITGLPVPLGEQEQRHPERVAALIGHGWHTEHCQLPPCCGSHAHFLAQFTHQRLLGCLAYLNMPARYIPHAWIGLAASGAFPKQETPLTA